MTLQQMKFFLWQRVEGLGNWCRFVWASFVWGIRRPFRWKLFFQQFEFIGVSSVPIIALTALFTGMVFSLQAGRSYALFNMQTLVGATVGTALTREIGPVFAALMVTARACSAMAAESGSMRVTEQIDALETMSVDPIQYLVVPRVIACVMMLPLLTAIFDFVGCIGSYIVGVFLLHIASGPFMSKLYWYVDTDDIFGGLIKAAVFGFFIATISCFQGFFCKEGAEGVGRATTRSVVISSVTVLVIDYFLTTWIWQIFPPSQ